MKKELRILVILIAVLLVGTVGYYFMPKKFGKNVNPAVDILENHNWEYRKGVKIQIFYMFSKPQNPEV